MTRLTKYAQGQTCIRCGADDSTIVSAHYSGPWQHRFGKGYGIKGDDAAAADLCRACHAHFDEYRGATDHTTAHLRAPRDMDALIRDFCNVSRSEEFLACCLLTVIRRIQQRRLVIR